MVSEFPSLIKGVVKMKKVIMLLAVSMLSFNAYSAIKCERNFDGTICCWDTNVDGPFKPIIC